MRRNRCQAAEFVVESIRSLGMNPSAESRLMKMHNLICVEADRLGGTLSPQHPMFDIAKESLRDFQLLEFVFDQMHLTDPSKAFRDLVRTLLKDSALPQLDITESKGRNAQFELYVFSLCCAANMHPVKHEEPDVTCFFGEHKYGIAAKRVKSLSKLEARVRKGASQILHSGLPGIVALDTCLMLNPENRSVIAELSDSDFWTAYDKSLKSFVHDHYGRFREWTRDKGVKGIILHDHLIRLDHLNGWELDSFTYTVSTSDVLSRDHLEFMAFKEQYIDGIPECNRR